LDLLQAFEKIGQSYLKAGQADKARQYFAEQRKYAEYVMLQIVLSSLINLKKEMLLTYMQ